MNDEIVVNDDYLDNHEEQEIDDMIIDFICDVFPNFRIAYTNICKRLNVRSMDIVNALYIFTKRDDKDDVYEVLNDEYVLSYDYLSKKLIICTVNK